MVARVRVCPVSANWQSSGLKALTYGIIYTISELPRQLPYSHDVCVYGFDGRHTVSIAGARVLLTHHAKCDHVAKMLAVHERRDDLITEFGSRVALSFYL